MKIYILYALFHLLVIVSGLLEDIEDLGRNYGNGYWFDVSLKDYDHRAETAQFHCSLTLFRRNLRPATLYHQVGLRKSNKTIEAWEGDKESTAEINRGIMSIYVNSSSEAGQAHVCEVEFGDGTKDRKTIEVNSLDGSPIAWYQSSMYPETAEVPYGAPFWIVQGSVGYRVTGRDTLFSSCDPREPNCTDTQYLRNYDAYGSTSQVNNEWQGLMRAYAAHSGFYVFTSAYNKGNATAYFNLKVGEPIPASWADTATITQKVHEVTEGDNLTLTCNFTSPHLYKARVEFLRKGPIPWAVSSEKIENGEMFVLQHMKKRHAGNYTCEIIFNHWTEKVPTLRATTTVIVKDRPSDKASGASALPQLNACLVFISLLTYLHSLGLNK